MTRTKGRIEGIELRCDDGSTIRNSEDDGVTIELESPGGERQSVRLSYADLADARRFRAAWFEQIGHVVPHYDDDDHAEIVQVMLRLCGWREVES